MCLQGILIIVIGGISHDETAGKLNISKSNLSRGRKQLQKILFSQNDISIGFTTKPTKH